MTQTDTISRPTPGEYAEYFGLYIDRVPDGDILAAMVAQTDEWHHELDSVSDGQASKLHAPYTWTIKQVVGHMIDTERVFAYRAARFAASDPTPLPGFDQDLFVANTDYTLVSLSPLVEELTDLRRCNIGMFRRMAPEVWDRSGTADGNRSTVRAIAYILVGHVIHHLEIVKKRLSSTLDS